MTALEVAERFLAARLATLSGVTSYSGAIPEGVTYPAIRFVFEESESATPQGETQLSRVRYRVEAFASGLAFPHSLATSLDGAIHGSTLLIDGAAVHAERVTPVSDSFVLGGSSMRSCGGFFDIWIAWDI